jgi:hypothetical protein
LKYADQARYQCRSSLTEYFQTSNIKASRFAKDLKFGEMRLVMTKHQIIKARGYPPAHKKFSTEANRWAYWSSKFVPMSLIFENGKLVQGRGLR